MEPRGSRASRQLPAVWCLLAASLAACLVGTTAASGQEAIFGDGLESNNTLAWDDRVGLSLVTPDPFRFDDLDLRDPHVFVDLSPLGGCTDFTDQALPGNLAPSFNQSLDDRLNSDGDGDGFLDSSVLLLLRPFDPAASGFRSDLGGGRCTDPASSTSCDLEVPAVPRTTAYDGQSSGSCLETVAGSTSSYVPAVDEPTAPCFVTVAFSGELSLAGLSVPLIDLQVAAAYGAAPVDTLTTGLLRGFLTEVAADSLLLPADLPLIGGDPLSSLLPGGATSCASGDDRDTHLGQSGWWFYLAFTGERVPYTGP